MRVLILCDAKVGDEIANWLLENYLEDVGAIVTIGESEVYKAARAKGIPSFLFESNLSLRKQLLDLGPFDLGLLAWWPKILPSSILTIAEYGFINTHPSLLPYNRGKHYNFWALVEQVPFGVSLHFVDEGIDSGDIVAQRAIPYDWEDTGATLYFKAAGAMVELFKSTYPEIRVGAFARAPQDLSRGSTHYAREIDEASLIELDKTYSARELINLLRARTFAGYPACRFEASGEVYEVRVDIKRKVV